jgi:hypothetical protein
MIPLNNVAGIGGDKARGWFSVTYQGCLNFEMGMGTDKRDSACVNFDTAMALVKKSAKFTAPGRHCMLN